MAHHSCWRSCFSRRKLTEGGSGKHRDDFKHVPSPSEWITRAEVICLFTAPPFLGYRLLAIRVDRSLHPSNTHALKNRLEPLRLKTTARCASRGPSSSLGIARLLSGCLGTQEGHPPTLSRRRRPSGSAGWSWFTRAQTSARSRFSCRSLKGRSSTRMMSASRITRPVKRKKGSNRCYVA